MKPICNNENGGKCIFRGRGTCAILTDTVFKNNKCPFFKSQKMFCEQTIRTYKRLVKIGWFDRSTVKRDPEWEKLESDYGKSAKRCENILKYHKY